MRTICCRRRGGADRYAEVLERFGTNPRRHCWLGMANNPKNRDVDKQPKPDQKIPPAGPHDKERDGSKTPGTGILPEEDEDEIEGPTG